MNVKLKDIMRGIAYTFVGGLFDLVIVALLVPLILTTCLWVPYKVIEKFPFVPNWIYVVQMFVVACGLSLFDYKIDKWKFNQNKRKGNNR